MHRKKIIYVLVRLDGMTPSSTEAMMNLIVKTGLKDFDPNIVNAMPVKLKDGTKFDDDSQNKNDQEINDSEDLEESKPSREKKDKGKGKKSKR